MLLVQKFGGSSLASLERLRRSAQIVQRAVGEGHRLVVVVSAAGDSTDELIDMAHAIDPAPPLREMDALVSTGEQRSAALMAIQLGRLGVEARSFSGWQAGIRTDAAHGGAQILRIDPTRLEQALEAGLTAVVAGFQGVTEAGDGAERCEIYTDVDGVFTADPRLIPEARRLAQIDSRDMLALARAGSQVLHPDSVRIAMERGVPLRLLSSFHPGEGTRVLRLPEKERTALAGVTRDAARGSVTLAGRGADAGLLPALSAALKAEGVSVLRSELGENALTLYVDPTRLNDALNIFHSFL